MASSLTSLFPSTPQTELKLQRKIANKMTDQIANNEDSGKSKLPLSKALLI